MGKVLLTIFLCLMSLLSTAQVDSVIHFFNPSFEDTPKNSRAPRGWLNCGFQGESPPDTQPDATFKVYQEPSDGHTYLGMVTRDNDTWEAVAQRLAVPLLKSKCYEFQIDLCQSESYHSVSQTTRKLVNYDAPVVLNIWGGNERCQKKQLLANSELIGHLYWERYKISFRPKENLKYLIFEVTYKPKVLFPINGNMLLDNLSKN